MVGYHTKILLFLLDLSVVSVTRMFFTCISMSSEEKGTKVDHKKSGQENTSKRNQFIE